MARQRQVDARSLIQRVESLLRDEPGALNPGGLAAAIGLAALPLVDAALLSPGNGGEARRSGSLGPERISVESRPDSRREAVDAAAEALVILERAEGLKPLLALTHREKDTLESMSANGRLEEIDKWLEERGHKALQLWQGKVKEHQSRRAQADMGKVRYRCALEVEGALAEFEKGMASKIRLKTESRLSGEALATELVRLGFSPDKVKCLIVYTKPLTAACAWVSENSKPKLTWQAIQNQHAKFRRLIRARTQNSYDTRDLSP